jgi:hypothetical protein
MAKKPAPKKKAGKKDADDKGTPKPGTSDYHRMQSDRFAAMADIHRGKARMLDAGKKKDPYSY